VSFVYFISALNKSQKVLGVEFAPISIPLERRKQTLGALTYISLFFVCGPGGPIILWYLFFHTRFWLLPIIYIAWIYLDRETCNNGGRKLNFFRNWIVWRYYKDYFPINLVKTAELDPKRNYLLASHPHGILSSGTFCCFATEANDVTNVFPGIEMRIVTLPLNFWLPFYRELCIGLGTSSAKKESINFLLSNPNGGQGAVLVPGGASESLESHPGSHVVQLKSRKGFIKVALQNGSPLVTIYCFGETDIFDQIKNPEGSIIRKIQNKLMEVLTFAPPLFTGKYPKIVVKVAKNLFYQMFNSRPRNFPIQFWSTPSTASDLCCGWFSNWRGESRKPNPGRNWHTSFQVHCGVDKYFQQVQRWICRSRRWIKTHLKSKCLFSSDEIYMYAIFSNNTRKIYFLEIEIKIYW